MTFYGERFRREDEEDIWEELKQMLLNIDENAVLEKWHNDEVAANTDERIFLSRIRRPDHTERIETVFEGINTRHGKTILNALLGNPDDMADAMGPADLQNFLGMYPTPLSAKEWKINSATGQKDIINIESSSNIIHFYIG